MQTTVVHEIHQKKHGQDKAVLREAPEETCTGQEVEVGFVLFLRGEHLWAQIERHKPGQ